MTVRYLVSTADDGTVTHLVRVSETDTTLDAEFLIDGRWVTHGSAMDYMLDPTLGVEVDEERAAEIVARLSDRGDPEPENLRSADAVRTALATLLPPGAPTLPDPVPERGTVSGDGWTITFVVGADGPGVDVLAESRVAAPIHAHVGADGTVTVLDSLEYEFGYDPEVPGDDEAAQARMQEHNDRVRAELTRKGLV